VNGAEPMKFPKKSGVLGCCLVFILAGCQTARPSKDGTSSLESSSPVVTPTPNLKPSSPPVEQSSDRSARPAKTSPIFDELGVLKKAGISESQIGYLLIDAEDGKVIRELNSKILFIPSSVGKVPSSVAALEILGSEHHFLTTLWYRGTIKKGVLKGDLYLKGGGDPFLTAADLMDLEGSLEKSGIRRVNGHFYFDESELPSQPRIDAENDLTAPFNTGLSALSSEFNQAKVQWKVNGSKSLEVSVLPKLPHIGFGQLNRSEANGELLVYRGDEDSSQNKGGAPDSEKWFFSPKVPKEGSLRIPIRQAGYFTASFFQYLAAMGRVTLPDPEAGQVAESGAGAVKLQTHRSLPLYELVAKELEYSNNLMSELVLLGAAKKVNKNVNSLKSAAASVQRWWKLQLPEMDWSGWVFENASGLGSASRMSPEQLTGILQFALDRRRSGRNFLSLLPIASWKGTLAGRMQYTDNAFRVWAKTGTQNYSSALAGYLFSKSGKKMIFAVLMTDFEKRNQLDQVKGPPSDSLRKAASRWAEKARALQDELLSGWIQNY